MIIKHVRVLGIPLSLLAGLLLAACGQTSAPPDAAKLRTEIAAHFPSLDGSTTAGPLLRLAACKILNASCSWSSPTTDNMQRTIIPDAAVPANVADTITGIKTSATSPAYMALIAGTTDLIVEARKPSADETDAAKKANVTLDIQPIAVDALVMLANVDNPISDISTDEIIKVYTGKIITWDGLSVRINADSADSEPIHGYQRQRNSGSQELIDSLVMHGVPMIDAPDMITTSMMGPYNMLGGNPYTGGGDVLGLGYSVYYYATAMFPHKYVKMIAVGGVQPTSATIASRKYPLSAEVYAIIRTDAPADSPAQTFLDWLLSDEGQKVVADSGYVPIRTVAP